MISSESSGIIWLCDGNLLYILDHTKAWHGMEWYGASLAITACNYAHTLATALDL